MTNRTSEALLERRALAEKATEGPWRRVQLSWSDSLGQGFWRMTMFKRDDYSVACYTVAEVRTYRRKEDAAHIAANSPDVVMRDIDEIIRLRSENKRLEKEAEWLANALAKGCKRDISSEEDCTDCPAIMCGTACPSTSCSHTTPKDWREAARKTVEENR